MAAKIENSSQVQLSFTLKPTEPYGERYFVPHSGVAQAYERLQQAIQQIKNKEASFLPFYIEGPQGVGKTHLVSLIEKQAEAQSVFIRVLDGFETASKFVDAYEESKREEGLFLFIGGSEELSGNPHIMSRLNSLSALSLNYPNEQELRPILNSLAERSNLKLSDKNLNYLLKRLPLKPLSFANIFAKVDELSLTDGKPAKRAVVKEAIEKQA